MTVRQGPAPRDQGESPFSEILEGFWRAHPTVLAASFVDREGECIDYYSSLEPFEAKVAGAHMAAILYRFTESCERAGLGQPRVWTVEAELRDLVVARVSDEYLVVLVLAARGLTARLLESLEGLVDAFSVEAGLQRQAHAVGVELGRGESGESEPRVLHLPEGAVRVTRVLARWLETGGLSAEPRRCYRLQIVCEGLPPGMPSELTLVHEPHVDRYRLRSWRPGR